MSYDATFDFLIKIWTLEVNSVAHLPFSCFNLSFHFSESINLPDYPGSAWRGALGHALKRAVCVSRGIDCADCLLFRSCVYPYIFETPPPPGSTKMRRYNAAPHPYALRIYMNQRGENYTLGLTLFGQAERHLPYLIHALTQAGKHGLGRRRQVFELSEVHQLNGSFEPAWDRIYGNDHPLNPRPGSCPEIPEIPEWVTVELDSPLRLRHQNDLVTQDNFTFADLFRTLLRRISMLTCFHTDSPLEVDFASLTQASREVSLHHRDLHWWDWTRYSSRQDTTMQLGGLLGSFQLRGADLEPFWPYLWLGQWTQAGKNVTMGLGRYRLITASLPQQSSEI